MTKGQCQILEPVAAKQQDRDFSAKFEPFYSYNFSAFIDCTLSPNGVVPAIKDHQEIWTDPDLFTFILCARTEPAGFAIAPRLAHEAYDMEQFFVLRQFCRTGAGTGAAQALF
ncbi:MAG TPA: hypothetical protein DEA94_05470 [Rhodobacteraceae bacterium]|nr:hypothetical protein [Paracoccaceae bacterium]